MVGGIGGGFGGMRAGGIGGKGGIGEGGPKGGDLNNDTSVKQSVTDLEQEQLRATQEGELEPEAAELSDAELEQSLEEALGSDLELLDEASAEAFGGGITLDMIYNLKFEERT